MKKILSLQILLISILLISLEHPSYGSGNFSQYYNKGIEFYKKGKYDQAGKEFEKAIKLKPNDVYALYGLGNTHYCKAKYNDAVKVYAKAISINPDYAKVHYSLSLAYSKLGMTREAEKQKSIFRKLSKGGEGTSKKHGKTSHSSIDNSPKKSLSHTPKKSIHDDSSHSTHASNKHGDSHSTHVPDKHGGSHSTQASDKHGDSHSTHASDKHGDSHSTHASDKHGDGHSTQASDKHGGSQSTHASGHDTGHGSGGGSHSIFQGYSGEKHKADERVFKNKHKKFAHDGSKNKLRRVKFFIKNKWYSSRINQVWICAAGYIFATQAWLCVVAFFCVIIWRIRERP